MGAVRIRICTAGRLRRRRFPRRCLQGLLSAIRGCDSAFFTVCSLCGGVLTLISVPCTRKAGVCPRTNRVPGRLPGGERAGVAQLVEHLICNQRVGGSNPFASSKYGSGNGGRKRQELTGGDKILNAGVLTPRRIHFRRNVGKFRRSTGGCGVRGRWMSGELGGVSGGGFFAPGQMGTGGRAVNGSRL